MHIEVTPARRQDVDTGAAVLAEAFDDDAVIAQIIPMGASHRPSRVRQLFRALILQAGLSNVDVARAGDNPAIVGAAVWAGPEGFPQRRMWIENLRSQVIVGSRAMRLLREYEAYVAGLRPSEPFWYLEDVGTSAAARGQGVGKALIEHRLAIIDEQHGVTVLEATSAASERLYLRYGFKPELTIASGAASGAVVMKRPAQGLPDYAGERA